MHCGGSSTLRVGFYYGCGRDWGTHRAVDGARVPGHVNYVSGRGSEVVGGMNGGSYRSLQWSSFILARIRISRFVLMSVAVA